MLQTFEAIIDEDGNIRVLEPTALCSRFFACR